MNIGRLDGVNSGGGSWTATAGVAENAGRPGSMKSIISGRYTPAGISGIPRTFRHFAAGVTSKRHAWKTASVTILRSVAPGAPSVMNSGSRASMLSII